MAPNSHSRRRARRARKETLQTIGRERNGTIKIAFAEIKLGNMARDMLKSRGVDYK